MKIILRTDKSREWKFLISNFRQEVVKFHQRKTTGSARAWLGITVILNTTGNGLRYAKINFISVSKQSTKCGIDPSTAKQEGNGPLDQRRQGQKNKAASGVKNNLIWRQI